jgi:hypothetical protein
MLEAKAAMPMVAPKMTPRITMFAALALLLAGCAGTAREPPPVNGMLLGGATGAAIGGLATRSAGGAIAGGLVGAAVGGAAEASAAPPPPPPGEPCYARDPYGRMRPVPCY